METYVTLGNGGGESSLEDVNEAFESVGCKLKSFYMLMGQYDFVVIFEAPDAHSAAMAVYLVKKKTGSEGARTQTLRAFGEQDFKKFEEMSEGLQ
jgi:uncharacterized protein with GYD domain